MSFPPRGSHLLVLVVLVLILVLGTGLALTLPAPAHSREEVVLRQAAVLAAGRLPDLKRDGWTPGTTPWLHPLALAGSSRLLPETWLQPPEEGWRVPVYERPVRLEAGAAGPDRPAPWALRGLGVLMAVLAAACVLGASATRGRPGVLAGAALVLIPGFAATMSAAAPGLPVILLGAGGYLLVVRGRLGVRRGAAAGGLLGLAWLAGPAAAAPGVAALVAAAIGTPAGWRRGLPWLTGGVAAGAAGWWFLQGRHALRETTPLVASDLPLPGVEGSGLQAGMRLLGQGVRSWQHGLADPLAGVPLWSVLIKGLAGMVLLAAVAALVARNVPRSGRAAGAATLAGLGTLFLVALGARQAGLPVDLRLGHSLAAPAACALAAGCWGILGSHARPLLGGAAVLAALGGPLLLHGSVLPRHHPALEAADLGGGVTYLDLGTRQAQEAVVQGSSRDVSGAGWPGADRRMVAGPGGPDAGVVLRPGAPVDAGPHVLSVRCAPPQAGFELGVLTHVRLTLGDRRLTSLLSSHALQGTWVHAPLPVQAAGEPWPELRVSGAGLLVAVSQLAVRRLALEPGVPWISGGRVHVPVHPRRGCTARGLMARLSWKGGRSPEEHPLPLPLSGSRDLVFPLPPGGSGRLHLELVLPHLLLGDIKAVLLPDPQALERGVLVPERDTTGRIRAPGVKVLVMDPRHHKGSVLLRIPRDMLPPQVREVAFLDASGRPVPDGTLEVVCRGRHRRVQDGRVRFRSVRGGPLEVVFSGGGPLILDRVLLRGPGTWRIPLVITR